MTDFQLSISLSRPFGTQFLDIFVSRHCAFGLYRVIHISPFQGDYLKYPYIVAALRDAVLGCLCVTALRLRLVTCYSYLTLSG